MVEVKFSKALVCIVFLWVAVLGLSPSSLAQSSEPAATPSGQPMDVDIEVQLHIVVASNASDGARLPSRFDGIVKELRPILPFTNYRLGATFLTRTRNGKQLSIKGVGRPLLVAPGLEASVQPTFYEISSGVVELRTDSAGRAVVQISPFRFGLRIPIQMGSSQSGDGANNPLPSTYEHVGITTEMTTHEGQPSLVGTLDVGRPNETLVLVLVATRVSTR